MSIHTHKFRPLSSRSPKNTQLLLTMVGGISIEALQAKALQEQMDALRSVKVDNSVRQLYNRFTKWVDESPDCSPTHDGIYITRYNVDEYFTRHIPTRRGKKAYIQKNVSSLQWYVRFREQVHLRTEDQLVVLSDKVSLGIRHQQINQAANTENISRGSDPHYGLQDSLSVPDRKRIMDYIYRERSDWGPASFSYSWGLNAAVRGASNRSLVMADLNMSYAFGPEPEGPTARAILLVLRKGELHKDRHDTDKQVCCWRHKEPVLCSVGATARHFIWCLRNLGDKINFFHLDKNERASWWDIPLIDWMKYEEQAAATRDILKATGVVSTKITHHRTAALQYAGFWGLAPWQVNTLTNHMLDKQHAAYQSVTEYKTCSVMAGFPDKEPYFIGRALLELNHSMAWYEERLLPELSTWRQQALSRNGDKSMLCDKVLNHIIPYFITVLVQDGIYFALDFPEHPTSILLRNQIPGYEIWARQSRQWVANTTATRVIAQVEALDAASLVAFNSLHNKFDDLLSRVRAVENCLGTISTAVCTSIPNSINQLRSILAAAPPTTQENIASDNNGNTVEGVAAAPTVPQLGPQQQQPQEEPVVAPQVVAAAAGIASDGEDEGSSVQPMDVAEVLGPNGRRPAFPKTFPKRAAVLVQHWRNNNLSEFRRDPQTSWPRALKMSFKKRLDTMKYIKARANHDESSLDDAARAIDQEKGSTTLDSWLANEKALDPKVRSRARRATPGRAVPQRRTTTTTAAARASTTTTTTTRRHTTTRRPTTTTTTNQQQSLLTGHLPSATSAARRRTQESARFGDGRGGRNVPRPQQRRFHPYNPNWRRNLSPARRREMQENATIMAGDAGHPGWLNETGITSGRRDRDLEAIDREGI